MFLGQKMPKSEASEQGLSMGEMFSDVGLLGGAVVCFFLALFAAQELGALFGEYGTYAGYGVGFVLWIVIGAMTGFSIGSWLLFVLFLTHALVGAVELGTDSWIQNITGSILTSGEGKILFVFTSMVMFGLRFCAEFIEKRLGLNPVGLLLVCAILACIGLNLTSMVNSFAMAIIALTVYGVGKTFFWPTMLGVASDRFPRSGAVAISIMGGIGMMSAGLLGTPGLGYLKDKYSGEALQTANADLYEEYKSPKPSKFIVFETTGIDGQKLGAIDEKVKEGGTPSVAEQTVVDASIEGSRQTLKGDSLIPATMAVIYLLLLIYFASIGGYKPVHLKGTAADDVSDEDESIPAHEQS